MNSYSDLKVEQLNDILFAALQDCKNSKKIDNFSELIILAKYSQFSVRKELSRAILLQCIAVLNWKCASKIAVYMIEQNHDF